MQIPRLRECREAMALTQEELAERAGISARSVAGYEAGSGARPGTVRALAAALEVELPELTRPKVEAPPSYREPTLNDVLDESRRAEELGHDWAGEVARLQQRSEYRLQQRLDAATTKKERHQAGLDFYEDWQTAHVLINAAIERGQATKVSELKAALDAWWERTTEFYAPARQRAQQDERLKDLDTGIPFEEERSARQ